MSKLAFVFKSAPHGTARAREGLDALLAATAFTKEEDIDVFFMGEGVLNLLVEQEPENILQRDVAEAFKVLDVYDINNRYLCLDSIMDFGVSDKECALVCEPLEREELLKKLQSAEKVMTF
ncbi:sulfurtransferase complex subunit TusC [Bisgaard Taxon 10/6]|uniref:Sulfurtransferase complex subunit TusC n=1 Tax=Exercitatus varius TaxID=67857 RepID=A0ABT6ES56_9PAST|nr:sulfurtransferase complex subunit TusC [Exercitatus varius]MDG2916252.1 sulfurtransferase complex subunit TusC [Exercitatus varius]MDG2939936.1 sulfurtransferase complex subunit TusC [Exercitatus varius]MDG2945393.1 sulfurtransferase complex subunit TusC [Exercitatus varius]MDG2947483.1 sulfurtransferase complex subunit TusC [Exercitatus varius]MDG2957240.1 sulfurtransferase complex subunit TusC [Exercitatus varius]